MEGPKQRCGICGWHMVWIRGRFPHQDKRIVCPTCLAERMDTIREMAQKEYGYAYNALVEHEIDVR